MHTIVKKTLKCRRPNVKKPQCKMRGTSDIFVQRLANPQISLQELSKQLPLPYGKIYILIEKLNAYQVPYIRAIWFIKITYNQKLRGNKWSDPGQLSNDFTTDICTFLVKSLNAGITTSGNQSTQKLKSSKTFSLNRSVKYALELLSWSDDESLIDPKVLTNFVVSIFQKDLLKSFVKEFFFDGPKSSSSSNNNKTNLHATTGGGIVPIRYFLWQHHRGYAEFKTKEAYGKFCQFFEYLTRGGVFPSSSRNGYLNGAAIRNQKKRVKVLYAQRSGYVMKKIVEMVFQNRQPYYFRQLCESLGYFVEFVFAFPTPVSQQVTKIQMEVERRTRNHVDSALYEPPPLRATTRRKNEAHQKKTGGRRRRRGVQQQQQHQQQQQQQSTPTSTPMKEYLLKEKVSIRLDEFFHSGNLYKTFQSIFLRRFSGSQQQQQQANPRRKSTLQMKHERAQRIKFYQKNVMYMLEWATTTNRTNINRVYVVCSLIHRLFSLLATTASVGMKISLRRGQQQQQMPPPQQQQFQQQQMKNFSLVKLEDAIEQEERKFDVSGISSIQDLFFQYLERYCLRFFDDDDDDENEKSPSQQEVNTQGISERIWKIIMFEEERSSNSFNEKEEEMRSLIRLYSELFRMRLYHPKQFVESMLVRGYSLFPKNGFSEEEMEMTLSLFDDDDDDEEEEEEEENNENKLRNDLSFRLLKKFEHPLQFFLVFFSVTSDEEYFRRLYVTNYFSPFYEYNKNMVSRVEIELMKYIKSKSSDPKIPNFVSGFNPLLLGLWDNDDNDQEHDEDEDDNEEDNKNNNNKEEEEEGKEQKVMKRWFFFRISNEILYNRILMKKKNFLESLEPHEIYRVIGIFFQLCDFRSLHWFLKDLIRRHPISASSTHPFLTSLLIQNVEVFMVCDDTQYFMEQISLSSKSNPRQQNFLKLYNSNVYRWDEMYIEDFTFPHPFFANLSRRLFTSFNMKNVKEWSSRIVNDFFLKDIQNSNSNGNFFCKDVLGLKRWFLLGNSNNKSIDQLPNCVDLQHFQWRCLYLYLYIETYNMDGGESEKDEFNNLPHVKMKKNAEKVNVFERYATCMSIFRVLGFVTDNITTKMIRMLIGELSKSTPPCVLSSDDNDYRSEVESSIEFYKDIREMITIPMIYRYICNLVSYGGITDSSMLWNEVFLPLLSLPAPPIDALATFLPLLTLPSHPNLVKRLEVEIRRSSGGNEVLEQEDTTRCFVSRNMQALHELRLTYSCINPKFNLMFQNLLKYPNLSSILSRSRRFVDLMFSRFQYLFNFAQKFSSQFQNTDLTYSLFSRVNLFPKIKGENKTNNNNNVIQVSDWSANFYRDIFSNMKTFLDKVHINEWNQGVYSLLLKMMIMNWRSSNQQVDESVLVKLLISKLPQSSSSSTTRLTGKSRRISDNQSFSSLKCYSQVLSSHDLNLTDTIEDVLFTERNRDLDIRPLYFLFLHYSSKQPDFATKIFRFVLKRLKRCLISSNNNNNRNNNSNNNIRKKKKRIGNGDYEYEEEEGGGGGGGRGGDDSFLKIEDGFSLEDGLDDEKKRVLDVRDWKNLVFCGYLMIRLVDFVDEYGLSESCLVELWSCYFCPSLLPYFTGEDELRSRNLVLFPPPPLLPPPPPPPQSSNISVEDIEGVVEEEFFNELGEKKRWEGAMRSLIVGNLNVVWNLIKRKCFESSEIRDTFLRFVRKLQSERNAAKKEEERLFDISRESLIRTPTSARNLERMKHDPFLMMMNTTEHHNRHDNWVNLEGYQAECSGCGINHTMQIPLSDGQVLPVQRHDTIVELSKKKLEIPSSSSSTLLPSLLKMRDSNDSSSKSELSMTEEDDDSATTTHGSEDGAIKDEKKKKKFRVIRKNTRSRTRSRSRRRRRKSSSSSGLSRKKVGNNPLEMLLSGFPAGLGDDWSDRILEYSGETEKEGKSGELSGDKKKKEEEEEEEEEEMLPPPPPPPPQTNEQNSSNNELLPLPEEEQEEEEEESDNGHQVVGKKRQRNSTESMSTDEDNLTAVVSPEEGEVDEEESGRVRKKRKV